MKFEIGDIVARPEVVDEERYYNTTLLSVNTEYEVIHVLDNGLLVLKDFLCLVHPDSVISIKSNKEIREKEAAKYKEEMIDYIGRCYKVEYDSMLSIERGQGFTVYYHIRDVAVQQGATSPYHVILDAETITIHDNRVEYCSREDDLRLDNTDIEKKGKEISLDIFEDIKSNFDKLLEDK